MRKNKGNDPRLSVSFTLQQLIDMAFVCRCAAIMARKEAETHKSVEVKSHHLNAAEKYDQMAERFEALTKKLEAR